MRGPTPAAVVVLMLAASARAEPLSIAQAMQRARASSHLSEAARARARAGAERAAQAHASRLPKLTLEEDVVRTNSPAEAFAFRLNQRRFSFGDFVAADPNRPGFLNTAMTRLEVTLPLYTGGELNGRIGQATAAAKSLDALAARSEDVSARDAAEAYVRLEQAREMVALLEHARETVKAHVDLASSYAAQGMIVRSDLLRAEVELARMDDMLAEARAGERVASAALAFTMAAPEGSRWEAATPADGDLKDPLEAWLQDARQRDDLQAARAQLRAGELEETVRRAAFLPTLGLAARGDLFDSRLFGDRGRSTTVVAQAKVNVFAGGSDRAALAAARWDVRAGREDIAAFEQGVELEVRQAFAQASSASSRRQTAGRAIEAAREAERIVNERFQNGVVRMIDVLDAATARREAETRAVVARADALSALLRLAVAAGRRPESVLPSVDNP